ncbi:hypothetical protein PFDG_02424, partial [Plasmodium falciparum Dd2]
MEPSFHYIFSFCISDANCESLEDDNYTKIYQRRQRLRRISNNSKGQEQRKNKIKRKENPEFYTDNNPKMICNNYYSDCTHDTNRLVKRRILKN